MKKFMLAYVVTAVASLIMVTSPAAEGTWTHFTGDNVTIPEYPIDMAIDHDGVLWVGNWYGLWSYDGSEWTTWWLGKGGEWIVPFPGDEPMPDLSYVVTSMAVDNNNQKWFIVPGAGIVRNDGDNWDVIPRKKSHSITIDHDNVKWFGTVGDGIWSFDDEVWTHYPEDTLGVKDNLYIQGATVDAQNVKWFTYNDDAIRYNGIIRIENSTVNAYPFRKISEWIQPPFEIAVDEDGVVWTGTGEGVISFEGEGEITYYGDEYIDIGDETENAIYEVEVGPDNVKWFGTGEHGVIRYDGVTWAVYDSTNGLPDNQVLAIAIDSDNVKWFGTETGVSRLEGTPLTVEERSAPAPIAITGNYPNPFNPVTTIAFSLSNDANVVLDVFNLSGQHVATLLDDMLVAGTHSVVWDGADDAGAAASSGVYFCRLQAGGRSVVHRMALVR